MTYRDDRDALIARADALEREAEQLRRENERLRDAAHAPVAIERVEVEVPVVRGPATIVKSADVQRRSIRPQAPWGFDLVVGLPLLTVMLAILMSGVGHDGGARAASALGVALVWAIGSFAYRVRLAMRERAWLERAPLGLAVGAYEDLLSEHHETRAVIARVAFEGELDDAARREIAAAIHGASRWEDGRLLVESPRFPTLFAGHNRIVFDNARVHRWVRDLFRMLEPLAAAHPIASVIVMNPPT